MPPVRSCRRAQERAAHLNGSLGPLRSSTHARKRLGAGLGHMPAPQRAARHAGGHSDLGVWCFKRLREFGGQPHRLGRHRTDKIGNIFERHLVLETAASRLNAEERP